LLERGRHPRPDLDDERQPVRRSGTFPGVVWAGVIPF
jgi:hypothetical protein